MKCFYCDVEINGHVYIDELRNPMCEICHNEDYW